MRNFDCESRNNVGFHEVSPERSEVNLGVVRYMQYTFVKSVLACKHSVYVNPCTISTGTKIMILSTTV